MEKVPQSGLEQLEIMAEQRGISVQELVQDLTACTRQLTDECLLALDLYSFSVINEDLTIEEKNFLESHMKECSLCKGFYKKSN